MDMTKEEKELLIDALQRDEDVNIAIRNDIGVKKINLQNKLIEDLNGSK